MQVFNPLPDSSKCPCPKEPSFNVRIKPPFSVYLFMRLSIAFNVYNFMFCVKFNLSANVAQIQIDHDFRISIYGFILRLVSAIHDVQDEFHVWVSDYFTVEPSASLNLIFGFIFYPCIAVFGKDSKRSHLPLLSRKPHHAIIFG